jgi:hypothetical protein
LAIEFHGAKEARAVVQFLLQVGYSIFGYLNTDKGNFYKEIITADIDNITGPYSLHHCIAGRDRKVLQAPIHLQL